MLNVMPLAQEVFHNPFEVFCTIRCRELLQADAASMWAFCEDNWAARKWCYLDTTPKEGWWDGVATFPCKVSLEPQYCFASL